MTRWISIFVANKSKQVVVIPCLPFLNATAGEKQMHCIVALHTVVIETKLDFCLWKHVFYRVYDKCRTAIVPKWRTTISIPFDVRVGAFIVW